MHSIRIRIIIVCRIKCNEYKGRPLLEWPMYNNNIYPNVSVCVVRLLLVELLWWDVRGPPWSSIHVLLLAHETFLNVQSLMLFYVYLDWIRRKLFLLWLALLRPWLCQGLQQIQRRQRQHRRCIEFWERKACYRNFKMIYIFIFYYVNDLCRYLV